MSHTSNRSRQAPATSFTGLPTGSAIGIIFAAVFTGALIAIYSGAVAWPMLVLYAAAVVLCTTFVNPRGIFLTVASSPLLFAVAVLAAGYFIGFEQINSGGTSSRAAQLLVVYPLLQLFPVLVTVTVASIVIGWVRIRLVKRQNRAMARFERTQRSEVAESNRRTSSQAARARERSRSVSVQELVSRERSGSSRTTARTAQRAPMRVSPTGASSSKQSKPSRQSKQPPSGSTRVSDRLDSDLYRG